ncbi:hypothetical protein ND991_17880 [Gordonia sputi]|uniref:hypothetical protein n=1 Tax=Gordonia sputi TaxID=36823 RepID=UPI002044181A|nr:hypothetical protein [Gordonia sputi]MCM3897078.1 hypothetical protein [Gordonia sputi]
MPTTPTVPTLTTAAPDRARLAVPPPLPSAVPSPLPLRVTTLGPATGGATLADVRHTLARADPRRLQQAHLVCLAGLDHRTFEPQVLSVATLVRSARRTPPEPGWRHVLVVYRGGGVDYAGSPRSIDVDRMALLEGATALTHLGITVIFGMGHAGQSCLPPWQALPLGVHEAITPASACEQVLRELVPTCACGAVA